VLRRCKTFSSLIAGVVMIPFERLIFFSTAGIGAMF
jgi:hypothetical protein